MRIAAAKDIVRSFERQPKVAPACLYGYLDYFPALEGCNTGVKLTKREVAMSPYTIKMTMAMDAGELPRWLSKKIIKDAGLTEDA
jgi:hypothetical protein